MADLVVIGEQFRKARPGGDGIQRRFRGVGRHVVFQFVLEAALGRGVARALVEHAADVGGERHVAQQRAREDLLAHVVVVFREALAHMGEPDVAAFHFGEAQHLQRLGDRKQFVHFQLQVGGEIGQVGLAVVGLRRDRLDEAGEQVGGNRRQNGAEAGAGEALAPLRRRFGAPGGHLGVDAVDQSRRRPDPGGRAAAADRSGSR